MSESADVPPAAAVPESPKLPEVESPSSEEVLDGSPSTEEVVERAQPADEIVDQQPTVDELLGRDR
jgi:hypothetical protein